jgi:hypothetical protein
MSDGFVRWVDLVGILSVGDRVPKKEVIAPLPQQVNQIRLRAGRATENA